MKDTINELRQSRDNALTVIIKHKINTDLLRDKIRKRKKDELHSYLESELESREIVISNNK